MARQIIFHKYQGTENGFLIYDIRKNGGEMNDGLLHMIRKPKLRFGSGWYSGPDHIWSMAVWR